MFNPRIVRAEMARKGYTVEDLSNRSGLPASTINKALGSKGNPTTKTLEKMAAALEVSAGIFFAPTQHYSAKAEAS